MPGALQGLKILDFTTLLPGPYATMCLADMGADVLKIVSGSRSDLVDSLPPFIPKTKLSAAAAQLGRGKRCMALNLKDPRAITIIHKLVADHDILIEQFRPGVMAKLKLAYEDLKKSTLPLFTALSRVTDRQVLCVTAPVMTSITSPVPALHPIRENKNQAPALWVCRSLTWPPVPIMLSSVFWQQSLIVSIPASVSISIFP